MTTHVLCDENIICTENYGYGINYTEDKKIYFKYEQYIILGVADGHGGTDKISLFIADHVPQLFVQMFPLYKHNLEILLDILFCELHSRIEEYSKLNNINGGSTLSLCVIDTITNIITISNLGDSVIMILRHNNNSYYILDHTLKVRNIQAPNIVIAGFGDIYDVSLNRTPFIISHQLMPTDYILITSDGLYEEYDFDTQKLLGSRSNEHILFDFNEVTKYTNSLSTITEYLINQQVKHIMLQLQIKYSESDILRAFDNHMIILYHHK